MSATTHAGRVAGALLIGLVGGCFVDPPQVAAQDTSTTAAMGTTDDSAESSNTAPTAGGPGGSGDPTTWNVVDGTTGTSSDTEGAGTGTDTVASETAGRDTGTEDTGLQESGPGESGQGESGPGESGPGESGPGDTGPSDTGPSDTGEPTTGGVAEWTCNPAFYDANDGCDCGCGLFDPDCADASVGSCVYCDDVGSCNVDQCPGTISPTDNAVCDR